MKKKILALLLSLGLCAPASAQTFTLNHASSYPTVASLVGFYGCNNYNFMACTNLITGNPSLQPTQQKQNDIAVSGTLSGTTATYVSYDTYDTSTANGLVGWKITVACHFNGTNGCGGGAQDCYGIVTANTVVNVGVTGITITVGNMLNSTGTGTCPAAIANTDILYREHNGPSADCTSLGWNISGSGTCSIDTTPADLAPVSIPNLPRDQQCVKITNAAGQSYQFAQYLDTGGELEYTFNGAYTGGWDVSVQSGSPQLQLIVQRGTNTPIINQSVTPSGSAWAHYPFPGTGTETAATPWTTVAAYFKISGTGTVCMAHLSVNEPHTNVSPFRDGVVNQIKAGNFGGVRYNLLNSGGGGSAGCGWDNLLQIPTSRQPCNGALNAGNPSPANLPAGPDDLAKLAVAAGAGVLHLGLPSTLTAAELLNVPQFFAGPTTSTYGGIRAALGTTATYTSLLQKIVFEPGNETWNPTIAGVYISGYPYSTSGSLAHKFCAGLKASPYWDSSKMVCGADVQQYSGNNNAAAIAAVDPTTCTGSTHCIDTLFSSDYYIISDVGSTQLNDCRSPDLWIDTWTEAWMNVNDPFTQTQQNLTRASPYTVDSYETSFNAFYGNCSTSQITGTVEGMGFGITDALTHAYQMEGFPGTVTIWSYWALQGQNRSFFQPTILPYSTTTSYYIGNLVTVSGTTYASLVDGNVNQPVTNTAYWLPDTYSSGTTYPQFFVVFDGSSHYYASKVAGNVGNALTDTTKWDPMATSIAGWGVYPGVGGDLTNAYPTVYAQAAANACESLGTGYTLTASGVPTYSSIARNSLPAETNVPQMKVFDYSNGVNECIVAFNLDPAASHTATFAGTYAPRGTVVQTLYNSASLQDTNTTVANNVHLVVNSVAATATVTLPAHSITTLNFPLATQYVYF